MTELAWRWRGRIGYEQALLEQRDHRDGILAGTQTEEVWLLEHDSVVTLGKRGAEGVDGEALAAQGIPVVQTERGGLATYHGPGQLVVYPLVNLAKRGWGVRAFVHALEAETMAWLSELGVDAGRRAGAPGVWVAGDKVAAVGLHIRKGVSAHGLSLNLTTSLLPYGHFIPCGIRDAGVTSLHLLGGDPWETEVAAMVLGPRFARRLGGPDPEGPHLS